MSKFTRRQLLAFFGGTAAVAAFSPAIEKKLFATDGSIAQAVEGPLSFTPLRLPHPLPIYTTKNSFLPTGINGEGTVVDASANTRLEAYEVLDDVVVPPEYERYVILRWGDRVFPDPNDYVGYNCDFTAFITLNRTFSDGLLWVNHEYVSYPLSVLLANNEDLIGFPTTDRLVLDQDLSSPTRTTLGEFLYNLGGSIVRVTKNREGNFVVRQNAQINRRIHGLSGLAINGDRTDGYESVTSWGSRQGDDNYLVATGPAATQVFEGVNSDGLGNRIIGTVNNCSGGQTPWRTILTAEENFQDFVREDVKPDGTQTSYNEELVGTEFGLTGEKYGWMVEVDPARPAVRPKKHTALGRYRHENIAFRIEVGEPLVCYSGDDRRGGHTWKFVSNGTVSDPRSRENSSLLENGTLYVARFNPNGTGEWIPLTLDTPTNPIPPSVLASVELSQLGEAQRDGRTRLPKRNGIGGQTEDGGSLVVDLTNQNAVLGDYQGKTLADFYDSQGAVLADAFPAGNLVGGTPTARPEDIEVHPTTNEVFVAYTDSGAGGDGYPDSRIFVVAKYDTNVRSTQQMGGLYKIVEDSGNGAGTTFRWQPFAQSGEAGAFDGAGFANVDNLAFDRQGNIWGVTDMSTSLHNGFNIGAEGEERTIDHEATGNASTLVGVFGNNWLFYIPTSGADAGEVIPFAYGPVRCEMAGPTFAGGNTLILSVQHPGEDVPINDGTTLSRSIEMLDLDGSLFNQTRTVPRGSSWPSNIEGNLQGPPRPTVIGIRRKDNGRPFV